MTAYGDEALSNEPDPGSKLNTANWCERLGAAGPAAMDEPFRVTHYDGAR